MDIFKDQITVEKPHLDVLNHVNNVVYLQWVQDIAGKHWMSKSSNEMNAQFFWVVVDHFIEYKSQAFEGEVIDIQTFIEKNEGIRATRIVEFFKKGKRIVRAKSTWVLIDRKTKRPTRLPDDIVSLFA